MLLHVSSTKQYAEGTAENYFAPFSCTHPDSKASRTCEPRQFCEYLPEEEVAIVRSWLTEGIVTIYFSNRENRIRYDYRHLTSAKKYGMRVNFTVAIAAIGWAERSC